MTRNNLLYSPQETLRLCPRSTQCDAYGLVEDLYNYCKRDH